MRSRAVRVLALVMMAMVVVAGVIAALIQSADNERGSNSADGTTELVNYAENESCRAAALEWLREMRSLVEDVGKGTTTSDTSTLEDPSHVVNLKCSTEARQRMTRAWLAFIGAEARVRYCAEDPAECDPAVVTDRLSTVRKNAERMSELIDRVR